MNLREFIDGDLAETFDAAGFTRRGETRFTASGPNLALVDFRSHSLGDGWLGFFVEWDVIPQASIDFMIATGGEEPIVSWGMFAKRIPAPAEFTVYQDHPQDLWAPRVPEAIGPARRHLLAQFERLLPWLRAAVDPARLLDKFETGREFGDPVVARTPSEGSARYVAIQIDSGPIDELRRRLDEIEDSGAYPEWVAWWRQRLAARTRNDFGK